MLILHLRINFFAQVAQKMQIFIQMKLVTLTIWSCQWFCIKNITLIKESNVWSSLDFRSFAPHITYTLIQSCERTKLTSMLLRGRIAEAHSFVQ